MKLDFILHSIIKCCLPISERDKKANPLSVTHNCSNLPFLLFLKYLSTKTCSFANVDKVVWFKTLSDIIALLSSVDPQF